VTEEEWLTSTNPEALRLWLMTGEDTVDGISEFTRFAHSVGDEPISRRGRLLAVACCRRIWHLLEAEELRQAVEAAERFAEGTATDEELWRCHDEADEVLNAIPTGSMDLHFAGLAAVATSEEGFDSPLPDLHAILPPDEAREETAAQADLIRDIFNPFRPVTVEPFWLTPTVVALAYAIYVERAFDRMPVLADALEEAGCDNADVLAHCRGDGPHARGCWVVDGLLGKS
jgi:hypothetical protein